MDPPSPAPHFSHHLILFSLPRACPVILLSESFAEQLEDITSNFCELLLEANRVKLSPVAVFSGFQNNSRTSVAKGDLAKTGRMKGFRREIEPPQRLIFTHPITYFAVIQPAMMS